MVNPRDIADIDNYDKVELDLIKSYADKYLKNDVNVGATYKTAQELNANGVKVCGMNMNTGALEPWAYPLDTTEPISENLNITPIQRTFINNLFKRNYDDYEDAEDDIITIEDRMKYLLNGVYYPQYIVLSNPETDITEASYLNSVEITLGDGAIRTIPYFHTDVSKPIDVNRNLGHLGPNFAIDCIVSCADKIILILRRNRDEKGSVSSRAGPNRTISALKAAGTPASAAFAGGMLETMSGLFLLVKEWMEETGQTPEVLFGDNCPILLKTENWAKRDEFGNSYTMAQILAELPDEKRGDAEYAYTQWIRPNTFLYQTTVFGAYVNKPELNPTKVKSGDLLRFGEYRRLAELIDPVVDINGNVTDIDMMHTYVNEALDFLLNGQKMAFDLQIMEADPRNTSVSFMVSCGIGIEISQAAYDMLASVYSTTNSSEYVSNSESAGMCAVSAYELAQYYDNPELYKSSLTATDCDKKTTLEVTNLFTGESVPVWRTHLDTLIKVAKNIVDKIENDEDSNSVIVRDYSYDDDSDDQSDNLIPTARVGQITARDYDSSLSDDLFSTVKNKFNNFIKFFTK